MTLARLVTIHAAVAFAEMEARSHYGVLVRRGCTPKRACSARERDRLPAQEIGETAPAVVVVASGCRRQRRLRGCIWRRQGLRDGMRRWDDHVIVSLIHQIIDPVAPSVENGFNRRAKSLCRINVTGLGVKSTSLTSGTALLVDYPALGLLTRV